MKINVITLMSPLHAKNKQIIKDNTNFINELNNELINEDISLEENVKDDKTIDALFIASGGAEAKFLKIKDTLSRPFIIFPSGKNNSLAAALEIKTYCINKKIPTVFLTGEIVEIKEAIKHVSNVYYAAKRVENTNLGVIGKPSDWLIASKVNKKQVKDTFHINLIDIKMEELYEFIDLHEIDTKQNRYVELMNKYKDKETLKMSLYIYSGIKKLVEKYNLKGLTIRCFDLLKKYNNTACLALALLNEEGIVCACEGDVPALLTMYLLYSLTGRPSFMANPSEINLQKLTITLAHCTVPFNMVNKYELMTHFESDQGIGIKGELIEGDVSICKISPSLTKNEDLAVMGKIKQNLSLKGLCRTQIEVQLDDATMFDVFKTNFGNHVIVTYADIASDFIPLLNLIRHQDF